MANSTRLAPRSEERSFRRIPPLRRISTPPPGYTQQVPRTGRALHRSCPEVGVYLRKSRSDTPDLTRVAHAASTTPVGGPVQGALGTSRTGLPITVAVQVVLSVACVPPLKE